MSDPGAFAMARAEEQDGGNGDPAAGSEEQDGGGGEPPPLAGAGIVVCLMG